MLACQPAVHKSCQQGCREQCRRRSLGCGAQATCSASQGHHTQVVPVSWHTQAVAVSGCKVAMQAARGRQPSLDLRCRLGLLHGSDECSPGAPDWRLWLVGVPGVGCVSGCLCVDDDAAPGSSKVGFCSSSVVPIGGATSSAGPPALTAAVTALPPPTTCVARPDPTLGTMNRAPLKFSGHWFPRSAVTMLMAEACLGIRGWMRVGGTATPRLSQS